MTLNHSIPLNHYLLFNLLNKLRSSLKQPPSPYFWKNLVDANDFLRPQCESITKSSRLHELHIVWELSIIIKKKYFPKICMHLGPQNLHLRCTNSSYLLLPYNYLAVMQVWYCWKKHCCWLINIPKTLASSCTSKYSLIAAAGLSHCLSYPDASRSLTGFQAQMNTSDSWPRRTVALLGGISTSPSISIGFEWLSVRRYIRINSLQDAVRSVSKSF